MHIHLSYLAAIVMLLVAHIMSHATWGKDHPESFSLGVETEMLAVQSSLSGCAQERDSHFDASENNGGRFDVGIDVKAEEGAGVPTATQVVDHSKWSGGEEADQGVVGFVSASSGFSAKVEGWTQRRSELLEQAKQFVSAQPGMVADLGGSELVGGVALEADVVKSLDTIVKNHYNYTLNDSVKSAKFLGALAPEPEVQAKVVTFLFNAIDTATTLDSELIVDIVADIGVQPEHMDQVVPLMDDQNDFIVKKSLRALINMIHEADEDIYAPEISRATEAIQLVISERPELALDLLY